MRIIPTSTPPTEPAIINASGASGVLPPLGVNDDDDSLPSFSSSPISFKAAKNIARRMRNDLQPQTRDRMWRFKKYTNCFKAKHAISWAHNNISSDELVAINVLNQLVNFGLLTHVVDPQKRFCLGENRVLYFRIATAEMIERRLSVSPGRGVHIMAGNYGGIVEVADDMKDMDIHKKIHNFDHILQQTVKELNETHGRLELMRQEVRGLIAQQISTCIMISLLYMLLFLVMSTSILNWITIGGITIAMIISARCGLRSVSMWSDLDSRTDMPTSIDMNEDNSSREDSAVNRTGKSYEQTPITSSITSAITKSIRSVSGRNKKELRRLQSIEERPTTVMREAYTLPDVDKWQHKPLFICVNSPVIPNQVPDYGVGELPTGVPFKFSSDLFEGTCLFRIKGCKSDNPEGDREYFDGRKRIYQSVVQGRFKEEVSVADVCTGHEFARPLKNLPHPFILKTATSFISKIALGCNIEIHTSQPFMEATLLGTSQVVRGDEPGNEPNITCNEIEEDCSVFGGDFSNGNVSSSRRKRIFSNPAKCKQYTFDTDTVYTFEFYQNLFDVKSYSLDLGFIKLGAINVLSGQPIQWLGKTRDGRYLWSFQLWHSKLLKETNSS